MHAVEDDVQVRMGGVVMRGIDGLMAVPAHGAQETVGGRRHVSHGSGPVPAPRRG